MSDKLCPICGNVFDYKEEVTEVPEEEPLFELTIFEDDTVFWD
jgi:C4-type Zn-finger protein